jgi:hypothetical protein
MTMTETITSAQVEEAYQILTTALRKASTEWGRKIAVHIRSITGTALLKSFHTDEKRTNEEKFALYKVCVQALMKQDDSLLNKGEAEPAKQDEPAKPDNDGRIDPINALPQPQPQPVKPEPEVVEVVEKPRAVFNQSPRVTADAIELKDDAPDVLKQLARTLSPFINPPKPAGLDEAELEKKVKAMLGNGAFPVDRVKALIAEEMKGIGTRRIEFAIAADKVNTVEGLMHPQVTQVARWIQADIPVWAWSPAGSGKTHMGRQIAAMLGVEPYVISVDPTLTVAKMLGYRNVANGDFVPGLAYPAYKNGGLLVLDEIDTGDPGVIASINAMLSNGHYLFPNGETVTRHEKFRVLACANTKGTGAVAGYTARNKLDAATLDRFAIIEFKYDDGLELAIATGEGKPSEPWKPGPAATQAQVNAYAQWVLKVRKYVSQSVLVSPRATINGCKALRAGIPMREVIDALVFKLCSDDTITRIKSNCPLPV